MEFSQTRYQVFITEQMTAMLVKSQKMTEMQALEVFINSETYRMICQPELKMWQLSPLAIFDLWENEIVNGDPRTSLWICGDELLHG